MLHLSKKVNPERERHGTQDTLYVAQKNAKRFSLKLKGTLRRTAVPQAKRSTVQIQTGRQRAPERMSPLEKQTTTKQNVNDYLLCVILLRGVFQVCQIKLGNYWSVVYKKN